MSICVVLHCPICLAVCSKLQTIKEEYTFFYLQKYQHKKGWKFSALDVAFYFRSRWLEMLPSPAQSCGCYCKLISVLKEWQVLLQGWPLHGPKHKHCFSISAWLSVCLKLETAGVTSIPCCHVLHFQSHGSHWSWD